MKRKHIMYACKGGPARHIGHSRRMTLHIGHSRRLARHSEYACKGEPARFNRISGQANFLISALFILLAAISVAPLLFVVIISLSSDMSIQMAGYALIPREFSAFAYKYLLKSVNTIGRSFFISIVVTLSGAALGLMLNSSMGYVLSRPGFALRKAYSLFIFIPMIFNGGLVASYMVNTQVLMLRNTLWVLFLPLSVSSFYIIVLRTFFQTAVPDSVVESALIDGAGQMRTFFSIVLPVSLPALATIGLFLTFAIWNEWYMAMLYIQSDHTSLYPLQYVLVSIQRQMEFLSKNAEYMGPGAGAGRLPLESARMALVVVVVVPIACSYPFFQKYFVSGLTIGAVKG